MLWPHGSLPQIINLVIANINANLSPVISHLHKEIHAHIALWTGGLTVAKTFPTFHKLAIDCPITFTVVAEHLNLLKVVYCFYDQLYDHESHRKVIRKTILSHICKIKSAIFEKQQKYNIEESVPTSFAMQKTKLTFSGVLQCKSRLICEEMRQKLFGNALAKHHYLCAGNY